jgi:hypothetical protein
MIYPADAAGSDHPELTCQAFTSQWSWRELAKILSKLFLARHVLNEKERAKKAGEKVDHEWRGVDFFIMGQSRY